ncbi:MAG: hypothetical protein N2C14_06670 [Planctomycetales bacterium]
MIRGHEDSLIPIYQPFSGDCVFGGKRFKLRAGATSAEIIGLFGEPKERDADGGVLNLLHYEISGRGYDFEFNEDGRLEEIYVVGSSRRFWPRFWLPKVSCF